MLYQPINDKRVVLSQLDIVTEQIHDKLISTSLDGDGYSSLNAHTVNLPC